MKNNLKKFIIIIFIMITISIIILCVINKKRNNITRPNYDYIAYINHSDISQVDAGVEYGYDIYKIDEGYIYIKSKSYGSIMGPTSKKDIASGILKNKKDLKKIQKDIEKDSKKISQSYISYWYMNNGTYKECKSLDDLENKLFK